MNLKLFAQPTVLRKGTVKRIDFRDNPNFSASVIVLLDNRDGKLKTGMNGVTKLPLGQLTIWEGILVGL